MKKKDETGKNMGSGRCYVIAEYTKKMARLFGNAFVIAETLDLYEAII